MSEASLRSTYDGLLADLDGVVYVGPTALPGAIEALNEARESGLVVGYVTNNASRPPETVAEHLRSLGLTLADSDVVTSAQIAADIVRRRFGAGARVLPIGGPGVGIALRRQGLEPVESADALPVAVVQGYGPEVGWHDLAEASFAIARGAHWVATNTDQTIPVTRGIAPGNGALVSAVRAAVGIDPEVAGKPQAIAFSSSAERLGATRPLVLGDRLDTDIEGANAAGFDSLLVLTGVHGYTELASAAPASRPTYIAADLGALDQPAPTVQVEGVRATSAGVSVEVIDGRLRLIERTNVCHAAVVRAALALVWSGVGVEPDEQLAAVLGHRVHSS